MLIGLLLISLMSDPAFAPLQPINFLLSQNDIFPSRFLPAAKPSGLRTVRVVVVVVVGGAV